MNAGEPPPPASWKKPSSKHQKFAADTNNGTIEEEETNMSLLLSKLPLQQGGTENHKSINSDNDPKTDTTEEDYDYWWLLFPLAVVSFMDAISFMVVAPSLIFFVVDTLHGSKETYGIILCSFSFASFVFKPILGYACDHYDNFRIPYLISSVVASIGGILYFYANNVNMNHDDDDNNEDDSKNTTTNSLGIWLLFWGRCLGGIGSANSTLGFTYIAKIIHEKDMTKANAYLSMMRVIGMTLAPASFFLLARVPNANYTLLSGVLTLHVDPLNSVGLLLFVCNVLGFVVNYFFLQEPPLERIEAVQAERAAANQLNESFRSTTRLDAAVEHNTNGNNGKMHHHHHRHHRRNRSNCHRYWEFVKAVLCFEILLFVFGIFCLNSNFQLLETALAPASNDALGWSPIQVSFLFGANAVFLLVIIAWTFYLSASGVSDFDLLIAGLILSIGSYILLYLWWIRGAALWKFITPVMLSTGAFPFLGAPTRSLYTKVVAAKSRLRNHQGTMQAILSMSASVSGFLAPGLVAAFVLRTPEQVTASRHERELTAGALAAPLSSLIVLIGVIYLRQHPVFQVRNGAIRSIHAHTTDVSLVEHSGATPPTPTTATELTSLVDDDHDDDDDSDCDDNEFVPLPHVFEPSTEAHRRDSSMIMGIPQFDCLESPEQSQRKNLFNVSFRKSQQQEQTHHSV